MISKNQKVKPPPGKFGTGSTTLAAAALQDHLSRKYQLTSSSFSINGRQPKIRRSRNELDSSKLLTLQPQHIHTSRQRNFEEIEYTLDKAPPPLTLAQRLGLVGAPPHLLDEHIWKNVKKASNIRQDSYLPCPICQEEFGLSTQVLLSCSHVFHLACLSAFERFSRTKRCPLCRTEHYQKRIIYEGAQHCRHVAASKIQAWWRGQMVRSWYRQYRDQVPPAHPKLRKKHFQKKLSSMTEKMVQSCDTCHRQAACVLAEADDSISMMRKALALYDITVATTTSIPWEEVRSKASEHLMNDCSVCLMALLSDSSPVNGSEASPGPSPSLLEQGRPLSLLSCGHVLHETCIEALERFISTPSGSGNKSSTPYLCPLCRAPYSRTPLTM